MRKAMNIITGANYGTVCQQICDLRSEADLGMFRGTGAP